MWGKIKSFMKSRRTPKELGLIARGVFEACRNNKKKLLVCVSFFTLLKIATAYISLNLIAYDSVTKNLTETGEQMSFIVGILFMLSSLFIPTLIYVMLKKSSFTLVDQFEEHVGIFTKLIKKFSFFAMVGRSYKTMLIIVGSFLLGGIAYNTILPSFMPALFGRQDLEALNVWNLFLITPFVLFFGYVLFVGTAIAIIKSLSSNLTLKGLIVYSIKKSLKSFWSVVVLFILYISVVVAFGLTLGDYTYLGIIFDTIMLALVVLVIYAMTLDAEKMEL